MIQVAGLEFAYPQGDFQLRMQPFEVAPGEAVALIGPSGSGKTTLLNLISGVLLPDAGRVSVLGQEVSAMNDADRRGFRIRQVGMVFQEFELLEYLSVLDNILLPYRLSGALRLDRQIVARAKSLAGDMGIGGNLGRHPRQLSQGERQRVALCRALLPEPSILLADEPTGNLDPANKDRALQLLLNYVGQRQAAFVAVTHEQDLLPRFHWVQDIRELTGSDPPGPASDRRSAGASGENAGGDR